MLTSQTILREGAHDESEEVTQDSTFPDITTHWMKKSVLLDLKDRMATQMNN